MTRTLGLGPVVVPIRDNILLTAIGLGDILASLYSAVAITVVFVLGYIPLSINNLSDISPIVIIKVSGIFLSISEGTVNFFILICS